MAESRVCRWSFLKLRARGHAEANGTGARKLAAAALSVAAMVALTGPAGAGSPPLEKFVDPLPMPPVFVPVATGGGVTEYEVDMMQVQQQLHRDLPPTTLWIYNGVFPRPQLRGQAG